MSPLRVFWGSGLKGKACFVQLFSAPVFIFLALFVHFNGSTPEALSARKMLFFEGVGQVFLALAAWNDKSRPNEKEFKDDFSGWARDSASSLVKSCSVAAMISFFVFVTAGRFEIAMMATKDTNYSTQTFIIGFSAIVALLVTSPLVFKTKHVPLLSFVIGCFLMGPIAAGTVQYRAGKTLLAASQFLYIANFPLAAAKLVTRWQGEILNFAGWFVLAAAVVNPA